MANQLLPIIFNPNSGKKYPQNYREKIEKQIALINQSGATCLWIELKKELSEHLKSLPWERINRLIVIGGDGTVSKTARFLFDHSLDKEIAIIPQGTANVLASALNLPSTEKQALKLAINGASQKIDVGLLNGKWWFLICLSAGYLAETANNTAQINKNRFGFLAYFKNIWRTSKLSLTDFNLELDGQEKELSGNSLVVANALSLFKLQPRKSIDFTDGKFDIMVAKNTNSFAFILIGLAALVCHNLPFTFKAQAKKIFIPNLQSNTSLLLDGEPLFLKGGINIEIIPQKLNVVML